MWQLLDAVGGEPEGYSCHTSLMQFNGQSCPAAGGGIGVSDGKNGVTLGVCEASGVKVSGVTESVGRLVAVLVDSRNDTAGVVDGTGC